MTRFRQMIIKSEDDMNDLPELDSETRNLLFDNKFLESLKEMADILEPIIKLGFLMESEKLNLNSWW